MSDDPYTYLGTSILRNKLGIRDADELDRAERRLVGQRMAELAPTGDFDLAHLRAIHRHLCQDVHPFREGNGRVQLHYLEQLAAQAGHPIDLALLDPRGWIEASRRSHAGDYEPMSKEIGRVIVA